MSTKTEAAATDAAGRRALVDEYARLDGELRPQRSKISRHEELGKVIRSWFAAADAGSTFEAAGDLYAVTIGPAAMESHVSLAEVYRLLGKRKFLEVVTVTVTRLKTVLHPSTLATLVEKRATGSRKLMARKREQG